MVKISVPDMHCENCVKRINKALGETGIKFEIKLEERAVIIEGCEKCVRTAVNELEDLGFTPVL